MNDLFFHIFPDQLQLCKQPLVFLVGIFHKPVGPFAGLKVIDDTIQSLDQFVVGMAVKLFFYEFLRRSAHDAAVVDHARVAGVLPHQSQ